jgi:large subunit ribosomal protein L29
MSKNNQEINALSAEQLKEQIGQEKERLLRLKFAHAVSPVENPLRIRATRRQIARLNTALTAKTK